MVYIKYNPGLDTKKSVEIEADTVEIARKNLSITQQIKQLTKRYGKYARFSIAEGEGYTPKQIAEGQQIGLDFEAQTMIILTPEQQKVYQANLTVQRKIQACVEPTPFARIISPLPY